MAELPSGGNEAIVKVVQDSNGDFHHIGAKFDYNGNIISSTYVSTSRTVNGKALSSNITLAASDVGASPKCCGFYTVSVDVCCFNAGTKVLMSDGTSKNIENVQIGDLVMSYDIATGNNYIVKVNALSKNEHSTRIATLIFNDGTELTMTDYHPIYTTEGWKSLTGYMGYNTLSLGDMVISSNGELELVDILRFTTEPYTTYSLDVINLDETEDNDTNDNFFANGICVHNANCPT